MKIKTRSLIGPALQWAVAIAAPSPFGQPVYRRHKNSKGATVYLHEGMRESGIPFRPDEVWDQCGPIIHREGIDLHQHRDVLLSLYEYSQRRWDSLSSLKKDIKIVCRQLGVGPGRWIQETKPPGKYHGMWMASFGFPSFGWDASRDFISETPLIAAMRCFVASRLGDEVEIPDDLLL